MIPKLLTSAFLFITIFVVVASPMFMIVNAQTSGTTNEFIGIPCDGYTEACTFPKLVQLAANVMTFLLLLSIPLATIAIAWAGWMILTAGGNTGKIEQAKEIFTKVIIGFFFALTAWLIVKLVTDALLKENSFKNLLSVNTPAINFDNFDIINPINTQT